MLPRPHRAGTLLFRLLRLAWAGVAGGGKPSSSYAEYSTWACPPPQTRNVRSPNRSTKQVGRPCLLHYASQRNRECPVRDRTHRPDQQSACPRHGRGLGRLGQTVHPALPTYSGGYLFRSVLSVFCHDGLDPSGDPLLARILAHQAGNDLHWNRMIGPRGMPVRDHHHKVRAGTEEEGGGYAEPHSGSPAAHHFDLFYRKHFLGRMDVVIRHQNPHSHPARLNNTFNLAKSFG